MRSPYLQSTGNKLTTELENDGYILLTGSSSMRKEKLMCKESCRCKRYIIDTKGRIVARAKFSGKKLKNYRVSQTFSFP